MVGGFSFYDRAEVKDILSYMKLVLNPHDSIALARVVNSPARGIGKTTMETLERIALTTGISTWDAIARATEDGLLPARALQALAKFRRLIEDARAMLGPDFADKLTADLAAGAPTFAKRPWGKSLPRPTPTSIPKNSQPNPLQMSQPPSPIPPSTPASTSASTSAPAKKSPPSPRRTPQERHVMTPMTSWTIPTATTGTFRGPT